MIKSIDKATIKFYLWAGFGYFILGFLSNVNKYPDQSFRVLLNHIWIVIYLIVINYILFERAIPWVLKKRQYIIENILLGGLLLFGFMMTYSIGGYIWREIGAGLHIYHKLKEYPDIEHYLENIMGYSMGSVF